MTTAMSYGIRWGAVITAIRIYHEYGLRAVRQGIFCESYPTLRARQIDKVKSEFPLWLGQAAATTLGPRESGRSRYGKRR